MIDIKKVEEEAKAEVAKEKSEEAKRKVKAKLKAIEDSEKITRNLRRELEDIYAEIGG